ncbi:hypothetical protein [Brumimicrobium aurantiacum]|uniref:Uncharacterized protein n=1 Tax=Brumimicrobium aurantiacum TaxID=1737063 RepID=A0A3E1EZU2_9FLAO|nr:hypothetical protein [Brumimicrobium aurantiacum]RFC54977.1 hypothetical protein DXU93_03915 [Brumimicrobium aurantiacum]
MQNYSLKIQEKDSKTVALINYLKSLDFVEVTEELDWWDELDNESKISIEKGLNDLKHERVHSDHEVKASIRERILNSKE